MKRKQVIALAALVLAAALILALALRNPRPPRLPADESHRATAVAADCLVCHGPGGELPRGSNHPLGDDCFRCHGSS